MTHTPPTSLRYVTAVAMLVSCPIVANAQQPNDEPTARDRFFENALEHREHPDDPYLPGRTDDRTAAPGARQTFIRGQFVSIQVNVDAMGNNIVGDAANEPSIAVNPLVPGQIVIGWRQFDNVASNFRQAGWGYSHDGGISWTFPGTIETGLFRSDPVLNVSPDGVFYYYSLKTAGGFTCDLFRSFDGGVTWGPRIPAFGGDKAWMTVDHSDSPGRGNIYMNWSSVAACCGTDIFTRSVDGGLTYSTPVPIVQNPRFGQVAVGPDGAVFVVDQAFGNVAVQKSTDALDPPGLPTFSNHIANIGGSTAFGGVNPDGLLGHMNVAVDHSDGPTHGYVYILGSVDPPGPDPLDVMFARSRDGGLNYDPPVRVNDDALGSDSYQWFGTMSVSTNGRIDVVFNDTRNSPDNSRSELYYTSSFDGGETWEANVPASPSFNHSLGYPNQNKLGDYYDMVSDDTGADLAYAATFNLEQDVYYLRLGPRDCNDNGVVDPDDIAMGTSSDCNANNVPDECEADCNSTGIPDDCDVANQTSADCNANNRPDECDLTGNDCNADAVPDDCQTVELANSLVGPSPQTVCPLDDAQFTVASSFGGLSYQWNYNGVPIVEGVEAVGTTTSTLTVVGTDAADIGFYSCVVHDGCISAETGFAELTLFESLEITQQPVPIVATCSGNTVVFAVATTGHGVTYEWLRDGNPIAELPGKFEDVNTPQLRIVDTNPGDLGSYTCVVRDGCGQEETSLSGSIEFGDIAFTAQPIAACVDAGETVMYSSTVPPSSFPLFTRWHKDGNALTDAGNISGVLTDTLVIDNASASDDGVYSRMAISIGPNCIVFSDEVTLTVDACDCPTPGDLNLDGQLDLADLQLFALCFDKNTALATECACANLDVIEDSIDLDDWSIYAPLLTGP